MLWDKRIEERVNQNVYDLLKIVDYKWWIDEMKDVKKRVIKNVIEQFSWNLKLQGLNCGHEMYSELLLKRSPPGQTQSCLMSNLVFIAESSYIAS